MFIRLLNGQALMEQADRLGFRGAVQEFKHFLPAGFKCFFHQRTVPGRGIKLHELLIDRFNTVIRFKIFLRVVYSFFTPVRQP